MLLDSVAKISNDKNPQTFLEECKYAVKKRKRMSTINEELNLYESDDDSENDISNASDENKNYFLNGFSILWIW